MIKGKQILILSTGDNHGAYEAAYKIAKFLYEAKYQIALVVKYKTKADPFIVQVKPLISSVQNSIIYRIKRKIRSKFTTKESFNFFTTDDKYLFLNKDENAQYVSADSILNSISFRPDLIISGMTDGFSNTNTLLEIYQKTNAKIYTWLLDMEHFTGGCHYAWDCKGYETDCNNCPAIIEESKKNRAYLNLQVKKNNIKNANIQVLAGSEWVKNQAKNSSLFKNQQKIFNTNSCIDTRIMNNKNRSIAKMVFDINSDNKVIFTGSWNVNDSRKGISYFLDALDILWSKLNINLRDKIIVLVAGEHYGKKEFLSKIPFKKVMIDYIKDYRLLSLVYQASDIFICSSIEDSGPMMVAEALACGTPVVGFDMGSVNTLVKNDYNGYVATLKNSVDLATGMWRILSLSEINFNLYSSNSINQIKKLASHEVAVKVIEQL